MVRQKKLAGRRGLATVETALVLPLLLLLIVGGIDLALQFHVRHCMTGAAREAARYLAVRDGTEAQAKTAALEQLTGINANFTVTCQVSNQDVLVRISVPRNEVSLGVIPFPNGATIVAQTTMRKEI